MTPPMKSVNLKSVNRYNGEKGSAFQDEDDMNEQQVLFRQLTESKNPEGTQVKE